MARSWLESSAKLRPIDWLSVIVDFGWDTISTDARHVSDLDEAIAHVDTLDASTLAEAMHERDGRVLAGSIAREHGVSPDELMARLLYLHPLATKRLRSETIRVLVAARGPDDGWLFPRYFPPRQIHAAWNANAAAPTVLAGIRRGGDAAVTEILAAERKLDGIAKLIEALCGMFVRGASDDAFASDELAATICGCVPFSIIGTPDAAARQAFAWRLEPTLKRWRRVLRPLVLAVEKVAAPPAADRRVGTQAPAPMPTMPLDALDAALARGTLEPAQLKAITDPQGLAELLARHSVSDAIASTIAVRIVELAIAPRTVWTDAEAARTVAVGAVKTALDRAADDAARDKIRIGLRKQTKKLIDKGEFFARELALSVDEALDDGGN